MVRTSSSSKLGIELPRERQATKAKLGMDLNIFTLLRHLHKFRGTVRLRNLHPFFPQPFDVKLDGIVD
jgi:hypothetical protein